MYTPTQCRLPTELMFVIFELLATDRFTLANLTRLNQPFQPIVEKILYRNMTHWLASYSQELFIRTVRNNKRLASYVRRFAIIDYRVSSYQWEVLEESPMWDDIAFCIGVMTNLKELVVDMEWNTIPISKLIPALSKLDLEAFTWYGQGLKDTTPLIAHFLAQDHWRNLQALKISLDGVAVEDGLINEEWCPNLIRLEGDTAAVRVIMPGRRLIRELGWYPEVEMPVGEIDEELAESLKGVDALCVSFLMSFERAICDGYFRNVQHLRVLRAENSQGVLPLLLQHLRSLSELAVDSKSGHWPIAQLFLKCPSLDCAYVMRPGYPVEEDRYDRDPLNIEVQYYRCLGPALQSVHTAQTPTLLRKGLKGSRTAGYRVDGEYVKVDGSMNFRHYLSFRKPVTFQADDYINTLQYGYDMLAY